MVAIDGIEFEAVLFAEFDGLFLPFSFPGSPHNKTITLAFEKLERLESEGYHFSYFGVLVFYDGAVEIDGDGNAFSATCRLRHIHIHNHIRNRNRSRNHSHRSHSGDGSGLRSG